MILKSKISGIAYARKAYVYSMPSFDRKEFPKIWVLFWYDRKSYGRAGRRMRNWPLAVALSSANGLLGKKKKKKTSRKSTTQKKTELTMFRRKLTALDYHNPDEFDCTGERNNAEEVSGSGFLVTPPPTWSRLTCRNRCCCCHWSYGRAIKAALW